MNNVTTRYPVDWIDEYVANIRDYVVVRKADNLIIKVPNEAHKLNESGISILSRLLDGDSINNIMKENGSRPDVQQDLYNFFIGLKQLLQGCIDEHNLPEAVERREFRLGFNKLPVLSEIALTYRCNLRCEFCYAGCNCTRSEESNNREMSTSEVKTILSKTKNEAQVPSVSFTGGEPVLRDDLEELIDYARNNLNLRVNLITNGTLIDDKRAKSIKASGLNSAQVSIESHDENIHDALTNIKGSFNNSVNAVKYLKKYNIPVHINTTINRNNMDCVVNMPEFVKSLGLDRLSMNLIIPEGSSISGTENINIKYSEISELILNIKNNAVKCGIVFMWYSPTPICIFNPVKHQLGNKGCSACDGLLSLSPSGDILPCSSWHEPVGNLLDQDFESLWESATSKKMRDKDFASDLCKGCEDFALCQGACPLYWKYFGDEELIKYGRPYVTA